MELQSQHRQPPQYQPHIPDSDTRANSNTDSDTRANSNTDSDASTDTSTNSNYRENLFMLPRTGNDNNPGTQAQPWLTIPESGKYACSGRYCLCQAGTYAEVVILKLGTAGSPITYSAYPNEVAHHKMAAEKVLEIQGIFRIASKKYIILNGFNFKIWRSRRQ